jgi:hypothetical protein
VAALRRAKAREGHYRNPDRGRRIRVSGSNVKRLDRAMAFYKDFHWGEEADRIVKRKIPRAPRVAVKLGKLDSVVYSTVKDGESATWEHEFGEEGGKKPDLVMDMDNKKLHIVGGTYDVQPAGIID